MANEYIRKQYAGGAVQTQLSAGISDVDTNITIDSVSGWPADGATPFVITIDANQAAEETVLVTKSGTTLTAVERGYDGTAAAAHSLGASVIHSHDAHTDDQANRLANLMSAKGQVIAHDGTNPQAVTGPASAADDGKLLTANDAAPTGWSLQEPADVVSQASAPSVTATVYNLWYDETLNVLRVSDGAAEWRFAVPLLLYATKAARDAAHPTPDTGLMTLVTATQVLEYHDGTIWRTIGLPTFSNAAQRDAHYTTPYTGARAYTLDDHAEWQYREDEWIRMNQKIVVSASAPSAPHEGDIWLQPV